MTRAQQNQAKEALAAVGLDGFHGRPVASLSAGQFQRVLFARTLLQDCPVILLDESVTAIDAKTTADLLRVVVGWHGEGRTVIAVLHDFEIAFASAYTGLLLSFHKDLPSGPTIILVAGCIYVFSELAGPRGSLWVRFYPRPHFES